jgi:hypothetical protein
VVNARHSCEAAPLRPLMFAHGQPDSLTTRVMGAHTPPEAQVYIHAMVMPLIIALVSNWGKGMTELERFPTRCMGSVSVFLDGQSLRIHMCHTSE